MQTDPGTIQIGHRHMNVEIGAEAALFTEKEYILYVGFSLQCDTDTCYHTHIINI